MNTCNTLCGLIGHIQMAVRDSKLNNDTIQHAIGVLSNIGYKTYDLGKFPHLHNTASFVGQIPESPTNLAEALLWKLGKWKVYKTFVQNYNNKDLKVYKTGGVVFSAFAKHLQDNANPIYDQHAIRALWAICKIEFDEQEKLKRLLFNAKDNWKDVGSGDDGSCYDLFVKHANDLCIKNNATNIELDKLLMPLGQAIKKNTKTAKGDKSQNDYQRFRTLCWPNGVS